MKNTFSATSLCIALALLNCSAVGQSQILPSTDTEDTRGGDRDQALDDRPASSEGRGSVDRPLFEPLNPNGVDPEQKRSSSGERAALPDSEQDKSDLLGRNIRLRPPPKPSEFERYVKDVTGRSVSRYGQSLLLEASRDFAVPTTATIPPEYRLNVGDTIVLYLTGAVDGAVEREIDNDGNIYLQGVGTVKVAGVRYADLRSVLIRAIGAEYRFFDVNVTIRALRGTRVYVTGFANNPGAFVLSSLATITNAVLQAGGPSSGGSFRTVKVYRNGRQVGDFDLYRLLRSGNRDGDLVLQNEDVLFIPPAGEQVAVLGSVQEEAIYELLPDESLADALKLAGGSNAFGDPERLVLYRTADANDRGPAEIAMTSAASIEARGGDIIEILSRGSLVQPLARQSVVVRVEGEVERPGNYYVRPGTTLDQILAMAGGGTSRAYLFGTRLERFSVRQQQRKSYLEALDQFRFALAAAPLEGGMEQNATRRAAEAASAREVLKLLEDREPDGRVVLDLTPASTNLPANTPLEANDRIVVPPTPSTVGVFGAVYRPASFLIEGRAAKLRDYIERAGGAVRSADRNRAFVVRANGAVVTRAKGMLNQEALPGDVVFVPVRTRTNDIWTQIKDIASVVFQLGLSAAVVGSLK